MDVRPIIMLIIVGFVVAMCVANFISMNKEDKIDILINWARAAVYEAEDRFGSGTGQIKLASVYNQAISIFPWLNKFLTYEEFDEKVVKVALSWLNKQIASNENVKELLNLK